MLTQLEKTNALFVEEERHILQRICAQFFRKNVKRYGRNDLPVGFVGSIAWHFQRELSVAASMEDVVVGTIEKSPMDGLIKFHQS